MALGDLREVAADAAGAGAACGGRGCEIEPETSFAPGSETALAPVAPQERIEVIDILRGWALLGILLVNMSTDLPWITLIPQWGSQAWINRLLYGVIDVLAEGKFYLLFSFLFGLGFAMQMNRAEKRSAPFFAVYARRLLALYGIGLLLMLLADEGQLRIYAALGLLLLLLRRVPQKLLLALALACLLFNPLKDFAQAWVHRNNPAVVEAQRQQQGEALAERMRRQQEGVRVHAAGSFGEIVRYHAPRIWESHQSFPWLWSPWWLTGEFPYLLLGFYAGRRRIFDNGTAHLPVFRKLMWWGLGVGLPGSVLAHLIFEGRQLWGPGSPVWWTREVAGLLDEVGSPALSLFYASAIVLLFARGSYRRYLAPLASAGRLGLSNYIFQWLAFVLITYSYGFALYGKFGLASGLLLALAIFPLQVLLSTWYVKRFRFGPAEWLWRSVTYWKWQPMRVVSESKAAAIG